MKRLDRAMYAFFLLALLADVARAQVPASFGGDSASDLAGSSIQSAARQIRGQIRVSPAGEVVLVSRRAGGSSRSARLVLPVARNKAANFALAGWARILSAQVRQATPVMLAALSSGPEIGFGWALPPDLCVAAPACGVFEHTGSPAP
jgi:hypothetical protein